jgi:hypothetical protein
VNLLRKANTNRLFACVLILYSFYLILFIYKTSFIVNGERYFCLFDDAMVSMSYARNLTDGHGLVWNIAGEKVEGFTNPLWVFCMALFHLLTVAASKISLLIQITEGIFLVLSLFFVKKIADAVATDSPFVSFGAVLLTAFYLPINFWSLQGMEVGPLILLTNIVIWKVVESHQQQKFNGWIYPLLGIETLLRPDLFLLFFVTGAFLAVVDKTNRKKHILVGGTTFLLCVLIQTSLRIWYYGEILPNTYYLKLTGYPLSLRISRGFLVAAEFLVGNANWIFLLTVVFIIRKRSPIVLFLSSIFFAQVLYSIYVGGDAWEKWGGANRYIAIGMPALFVLFTSALSEVLKKFLKTFSQQQLNFVFCSLLVAALFQLNAHGLLSTRQFLLIEPAHEDSPEKVRLALSVKKITSSHARIAVAWAGIIPYFSDRFSIDFLGKSDKRIAKQKAKEDTGPNRFRAFYPGHLKWDYQYSIAELKPDVVVQLWHRPEDAKRILEPDYERVMLENEFPVYLRRESANILWSRVKGRSNSK